VTVSSIAANLALRPVALGVSLLAVAGGHAAYEASAKSVAITVDGQHLQVTTHASTVGEVLAANHLPVSSHDLLSPSASTPVTDRTIIVLRRGREMQLNVDGTQRTVWVNAMSVDEALDQIGLRAPGSLLSADRSRAIPLKGFSLDVRTRKDVQLLDGGKVRRTATHALQVKDVLREMRVNVRRNDRLSIRPDATVKDGLVIRVTRLDGRRVSEDVAIPFATSRRPDSSMYKGDTKVLRPGRVGALHKTYLLNFVNGKLSTRRVATMKRTAEPVTRIIAFGTKARPESPGSVAGVDGLNWGALARCESGGNPRAVSPNGRYRGLYQFALSTWHGVGGSGDPIDASSSEQTYRAKLLYKRSGRGAWPTCGRYL
jgi:uncharacterized protein YabE (DUF348 family)